MSLKIRLVFTVSVLFMLSLGLFGVVQYETLKRALMDEVDETLALRSIAISSEIRRIILTAPGGMKISLPELSKPPFSELSSPEIFVQIYDSEGKVLATSENLQGTSLPIVSQVGKEHYETLEWEKGQRIRLLTVPGFVNNRLVYMITLGESLHLVNASLHKAAGLMIITGLSTMILVIMVTGSFLAWGLSPFQNVARIAETIVHTGDVSQRVPLPRSHDEVGRVASAFNALLVRVQELLEAQRRLLENTSHELRNPLTVVRTDLDLLKRELDIRTREEVCQEAESEVARMARLVNELMFLFAPDNNSLMCQEHIKLEILTREVVERMKLIASDRIIQLEVLARPIVKGDADQISRILRNLLENAINYTLPRGNITVRVWASGGKAYIAVEDDGQGISKEHLPYIFDRFYRVDKARSRASGGTGLGLAIAKTIALSHRGIIEVESELNKGSRFTFSMPSEPSLTGEETPGK